MTALIPITQPAEFNFTDNPVNVRYFTDGHYQQQFEAQYYRLAFHLSMPDPGDTITFTFNNEVITFTGAVTPTNANEFKAHLMQTTGVFLQELVAVFNAHPILRNYIFTYYTISTQNNVIFQTLQYIETIEVENTFALTLDLLNAGRPPIRNLYAKFICHLMESKNWYSTVFTKFSEMSAPVVDVPVTGPSTYNIDLSIQEHLKTMAEKHYNDNIAANLPHFEADRLKILPDIIQRFKLFTYLKTTNSEFTIPQLSEEYKLLIGGLPYLKFPSHNFFASHIPSKFLTNQLREKLATCNQPEWLYFMMDSRYGNNPQVRCFVTINYINNEAQVIEPFQEQIEINRVYAINMNYKDLNLAAVAPDLEIHSWSARIEIAEQSFKSETFTYFLVDEDLFDQYFIFRNAFGCYDTIRTTGPEKMEFKVKSKAYQHQEKLGYSKIDKQITSANEDSEEEYTVSTGPIESNEELMWMKGFLLSNHHYKVAAKTKEFIPIQVPKKEAGLKDNSNFLNEFSFDYRLAFSDKNNG